MAKSLPSDIWRLGTALTPVEKLVALALADYGDRIYPSQGTLAVKTGLHPSTINRVVASLRSKGLVTTSGAGKALSYQLNLSQKSRGTSAPAPEHLSHKSRGALAEKQRDPNESNELAQEPAAADAARGEGWAVFEPIRSRILQRDPRADFGAQERVCRRVMAQHGLTMPEAQWAWGVFCDVWARTGNAAYDTLSKVTIDLTGARDVRALVLHRIKAVAA
jgi:hypothetical protein